MKQRPRVPRFRRHKSQSLLLLSSMVEQTKNEKPTIQMNKMNPRIKAIRINAMPKSAAISTNRTNCLAISLLFCLLIVAFQTSSQVTLALQQPQQPPQFQTQADHEQANGAGALGVPDSAVSSVLMDSASAIASPDDLIAAESSQSPDEHKAFTSAQLLRQEQSAASIAPSVFGPAPSAQAGQPQVVFQPPSQRYAPQQQAQQAMHHSPHQPHHPKAAHLNQFMAAALAGNYGPAQQQMAAAALQAQQQQHQHQHQHQHQAIHHPQQPQQQHGPAAMHPVAQQHNNHHHGNSMAPAQMAAPSVPHQQQQAVIASQQHSPQAAVMPQPQQQQLSQMAPQESSIRHNILPAPSSSSSLESNAIDETPAASVPQQSTQLAVASSGQHPVIASASSAIGSSSAVSSASSQQEAWPLSAPDIPKIVNLEVKCEKNLMKVSVEFDKIFNGVIFSKGHFNQGQCVHVGPQSNKQQAYFDISINSCGTQGNTQNGLYGMGQNTGSGTFFENTIVIQYDPNVQEVYDHARKLRCTWHDQYEKAVTFRPFPVDMLDIVRADFAGDNVGCWMQIQVGKGPWASEVAGIVKIGQTMTMVLAIKDEENKFDMLVRNCFAHDGKRGPIELVDKSGCITRPKLMSRFTKIKNFGSSATVLSYAHFQAFKFPDSMEVHFQCTIQICRHQCPEQCSAGPNTLGGSNAGGETYSESTISGTFNINPGSQAQADQHQSMHLRKFGSPAALSRERRSTNGSHHLNHHHNSRKPASLTQSVGLNRVIQVVSTGDLAFAINRQQSEPHVVDGLQNEEPTALASSLAGKLELTGQQICMSSYNFVLALVMLVLILLCSCLLAVSLYIRQRSLLANGKQKPRNGSSSSSNSSTIDRHLIPQQHHQGSPSPSAAQTTPPPKHHQFLQQVPTTHQYYSTADRR